MHLVATTLLAELFQFKSFLEQLFVLVRMIVDRFAVAALQTDHVVLAHRMVLAMAQWY